MQSGTTLGVSAGSIDNTAGGRLQNAGTGNTIVTANSIANNGGTLGGNGYVDLTASTLTNTNGSISSGAALDLNIANSLSNGGGNIYAAGNLTFSQGGASLDNTSGFLREPRRCGARPLRTSRIRRARSVPTTT